MAKRKVERDMGFKEAIEKSEGVLRAFVKDRALYDMEKDVLDMEKERLSMVWEQVHVFLKEQEGEWVEPEIRECVKKVWLVDLNVCEGKINRFSQAIEVEKGKRDGGDKDKLDLYYQYLNEWLELYDRAYALVSYRSLEHFAMYMEMDKKDGDKVWKYSLDPYNDGGYTGVNKGFFFYFTQMVLDRKIKFISKQQSTGTGKSHSNHYAIAWLLGQNKDNDVLVVLGNPALVSNNIGSVVSLMKNPRFVKVFPEFDKYLDVEEDKNGNIHEIVRDEMFDICRMDKGLLKLADSSKPMNLKVISKDTPIDGIRIRFLFLDDICRSKDAGNMKQHEIDLDNYWNSWWKRNYDTNDFYVILGGTAYSIFDIASQLISYYSKGKMKNSAVNKYSFLSMDESCVFIKVPKIDEDLDRSTYPQKFSYEDAMRIKERDYRSFMAMEQQRPLPPENSPFYIDNLQTYEVVPKEGRSEFCWASLDSARLGNDNNSMPILAKVGDLFYLIDCLYLNVPMEKMYSQIIDKIEEHKITKFVIENNIDTSLKALLDRMLEERGVSYCEIIEQYATVKKEEKIYNMETSIKNRIVFPDMSLYAYSSQMGKFMNDVYGFSYTHKNEHDDSIDSLATFCQVLILGNGNKKARAKLLFI